MLMAQMASRQFPVNRAELHVQRLVLAQAVLLDHFPVIAVGQLRAFWQCGEVDVVKMKRSRLKKLLDPLKRS